MPVLIIQLQEGNAVLDALTSLGLIKQHDAEAVNTAIQEVLSKNQTVVAQYREGQHKVLGYLVGQVMKLTHGNATAAAVSEQLVNELAK